MQRRQNMTMRSLAALTIAAAAGLAMSSCSPGADYPSIFPAVHDMPPPRADTPLDADQVQQATETLITERNHLSAAAQGAGQDKNPANSSSPAAANAAKKPRAVSTQAATGGTTAAAAAAAAGNGQGGPADGTPAVGAETK